MCDVCFQNPCDRRCPNADIKTIGVCEVCKGDLYAEETYWTDCNDNMFCSKECAVEYNEIREIDS